MIIRRAVAQLQSALDVLLGRKFPIDRDDYERLFKAGQIRTKDGIYIKTEEPSHAHIMPLPYGLHNGSEKTKHQPQSLTEQADADEPAIHFYKPLQVTYDKRCTRGVTTVECPVEDPCDYHHCKPHKCDCTIWNEATQTFVEASAP